MTTDDIGGINYMYSHIGQVYYDIVLVFDSTTNFNPDVLNGFVPSKNAAAELIAHLRIGDKIGWVNGTNQKQPIDTSFNKLLSNLSQFSLIKLAELLLTE